MNPSLPVASLTDVLADNGIIKPNHKSHLEKLFVTKGKMTVGDLQRMNDQEWTTVTLPPGLIQVIRDTVGPPPVAAPKPVVPQPTRPQQPQFSANVRANPQNLPPPPRQNNFAYPGQPTQDEFDSGFGGVGDFGGVGEDAEAAVGDMLNLLGGDDNKEAELLVAEGWQEEGESYVDDGGWGEVLDTFSPALNEMTEEEILNSAFGSGGVLSTPKPAAAARSISVNQAPSPQKKLTPNTSAANDLLEMMNEYGLDEPPPQQLPVQPARPVQQYPGPARPRNTGATTQQRPPNLSAPAPAPFVAVAVAAPSRPQQPTSLPAPAAPQNPQQNSQQRAPQQYQRQPQPQVSVQVVPRGGASAASPLQRVQTASAAVPVRGSAPAQSKRAPEPAPAPAPASIPSPAGRGAIPMAAVSSAPPAGASGAGRAPIIRRPGGPGRPAAAAPAARQEVIDVEVVPSPETPAEPEPESEPLASASEEAEQPTKPVKAGKFAGKFRESLFMKIGNSMGGMAMGGPPPGMMARPKPSGGTSREAEDAYSIAAETTSEGSLLSSESAKAKAAVKRPARRPPTRLPGQGASVQVKETTSILSVDPSQQNSSASFQAVSAQEVSAVNLSDILDGGASKAPLTNPRPGVSRPGRGRGGPARRPPGGAASPASTSVPVESGVSNESSFGGVDELPPSPVSPRGDPNRGRAVSAGAQGRGTGTPRGTPPSSTGRAAPSNRGNSPAPGRGAGQPQRGAARGNAPPQRSQTPQPQPSSGGGGGAGAGAGGSGPGVATRAFSPSAIRAAGRGDAPGRGQPSRGGPGQGRAAPQRSLTTPQPNHQTELEYNPDFELDMASY